MPVDPESAAFRIGYRFERACLQATITGRIDRAESVLAMFLDLAREVQRIQASTLLVLDHTEGRVPDAEEFRGIVQGVEGMGLADVRIAYVDVTGTAMERVEVGELIARESGYALRTFDNVALARVWLRYGEG